MSKANPFPWRDLGVLIRSIGMVALFLALLFLTLYTLAGAIVWTP